MNETQTPAEIAAVVRKVAARINSIDITLHMVLDRVSFAHIEHDDALAVEEGIRFLKIAAEELALRPGFENEPLILWALRNVMTTWNAILEELS